jgi:hypothetical protein
LPAADGIPVDPHGTTLTGHPRDLLFLDQGAHADENRHPYSLRPRLTGVP